MRAVIRSETCAHGSVAAHPPPHAAHAPTQLRAPCRYARDWILNHVDLCRADTDAVQVAQAMLQLGIFYDPVSHGATFSPKTLYRFPKPDANMPLLDLRKRIVTAEDDLLTQIKHNQQVAADANERHIQLDWRVSVGEARLAAAERTLRAALAAQQLAMAAALLLLLARYARLPAAVLDGLTAIAAALAGVLAVETFVTLRRFTTVRVRTRTRTHVCCTCTACT